MKKYGRGLNHVLAVCVFLLIASAVSADPAGGKEAKPVRGVPTDLKVAVVDVPRLFNQLAEWRDYHETLRQERHRMDRVRRMLNKDLDMLETEIQQLGLGTEERAAKEDEYMRKRQEHELRLQQFKQKLVRRSAQVTQDIYKKILVAINEYAQRHEIDLVMKTRAIEVEKTFNPLQEQLNISAIVYAGGQADITDHIAGILNQQYGKLLEVK